MNYSTAVFLINNKVRALKATYQSDQNAARTTFKTLDPSIKVGDFIIVPTNTRHNMTVNKVMEVDVDVDFDSNDQMAWVIGKVDRSGFEKCLEQEAQAITAIKGAELKKKRDDLRETLLAKHMDEIKALPIAAMNGDTPQPATE